MREGLNHEYNNVTQRVTIVKKVNRRLIIKPLDFDVPPFAEFNGHD
jgi:hypothetical protein